MDTFRYVFWTSIILEVCVFLCQVVQLDGERVLGEENDEFDFDGLPGAHHEFKVHIPGNTEDCFFQPVAEGANLIVNYEVLKGGDLKVDFYVRNIHWTIIEAQSFQSRGVYSLDNATPGTYAICIDNASTRFGSKLVYIYIMSYVMLDWIAYQTELNEVNIVAANFTASLTSVQESVSTMMESQARARFDVIRDWYMVYRNNYYVLYWSLAQCILIVAASLGQVYSVRRLFRTSNVTPTTAKPRA